jgi:hypothetical protein
LRTSQRGGENLSEIRANGDGNYTDVEQYGNSISQVMIIGTAIITSSSRNSALAQDIVPA